MAFGKFEGGVAASVPLHEAPKKQEEIDWRELDTERSARLGWILNKETGFSLEQFGNILEDTQEFPEDYPNFDEKRMTRLLSSLKEYDANSEEFREIVEKVIGMIKE